MAQTPTVSKFYSRLTLLLVLGLVLAAVFLFSAEPGEGNISIAGAAIGLTVAGLAYAIALFTVLFFMRRVASVIASTGGPADMSRYSRLKIMLAIGVAVAAIIALFTDLSVSATNQGRFLFAAATALAVSVVVMLAFLWFLRTLVAHSSMRDAPSVAGLYLRLFLLVAIGVIVGVYTLASATPGSGPFNVASGVVAAFIVALTTTLVTLGMLLMLRSTADNAMANSASGPTDGPAAKPAPASGANSDPGFVYDDLSDRTSGRPTIDVEGIGKTYSERLEQKFGITTCGQLAGANAAEVGPAIGTTAENVVSWQRMINLMDIKGIGPQYSEILVMAGIHTPAQLASANSSQLLATIDGIEAKHNKKRVVGVNIEEGMVKRFITLAKTHEKQ